MPAPRLRRFWRPWLSRTHAWAGLVLSVWLALLGATGTLLAFRDDWVRAAVPEAAAPPPEQTPEGLAARTRAAEAAFGSGAVRRVLFAGGRIGVDQVYLNDGGGAYLDPRTGAVLSRWEEHGRAVDILFELHHRLLLGEAGRQPVGILGLALVLLTLAGLFLAPASWRSFRGRVWPANGRRAALLAAHRDLGLIAAPFLILMALSGAALCFPQSFRAVAAWLSGPLPGPAATRPEGPPPPAIPWEAVFRAARDAFPDAAARMANWPTASSPGVELRLRRAAEWHPNGRTTLRADPRDGRELARFDALSAPPAFRALLEAYAVHSARVGGRPWQAAVALSGVALALLSGYGALAFVRRLRNRPGTRGTGAGRAAPHGAVTGYRKGPAPSLAQPHHSESDHEPDHRSLVLPRPAAGHPGD
ncbi:MAG TPA: PepSY-associated TM helix domain-containing protein [Azospirillaceae bacterium]|nr:PepSY-associated TM helix domain-containing protein [Azospirillaceae bacterium]